MLRVRFVRGKSQKRMMVWWYDHDDGTIRMMENGAATLVIGTDHMGTAQSCPGAESNGDAKLD
jgi:hypothetical protein